MTLEDYSKYYVQESDHYLIPKDDFIELFNEMVNWREETNNLKSQLKGTTHCFDEEEHRELKKQLDEINNFIKKSGFVNIEQVMLNYCGLLGQQKEFIKYLQEEINVQIQEESIGCEITNKRYILEEILQKYKSIIGDDK